MGYWVPALSLDSIRRKKRKQAEYEGSRDDWKSGSEGQREVEEGTMRRLDGLGREATQGHVAGK
jgi:hypothetical protein